MALSMPLAEGQTGAGAAPVRAESLVHPSSSSQAGLGHSLGTSQPPAGGALGQIFHPTQQSSSCLQLLPCFWLFLQTAEQRMVLKLQ